MKRILAIICTLIAWGTLGSHDAEAQVRVYRGNSTYSGDIICTVRDGKIYRKNSSYSGDILCRINGSRIYSGNSSYSGDILYNIRDSRLYRGNSSYSGDILYRFDGPLTLPEFYAVWYVVNYVY